ncbi:hypothetical protein [Ruegeria lacuscaerulensis]|uniref:hypothetical protein n=1 Tax=Ruegeria lacuscaerulensis TaxID=55218 RepID=UPI001481574A|nr:hypothetical protein [Ruegeria lacuscaerulensis]
MFWFLLIVATLIGYTVAGLLGATLLAVGFVFFWGVCLALASLLQLLLGEPRE